MTFIPSKQASGTFVATKQGTSTLVAIKQGSDTFVKQHTDSNRWDDSTIQWDNGITIWDTLGVMTSTRQATSTFIKQGQES